MNEILYKIFSLPAILVAITVHEYAHGYVSYKLGDPTAKSLGRLSLNPLHHLDPIGALLMLLVGFGWAKPVPVNARYFKNPRKGMALVSVAGPASNILLAILSALIYLLSILGFNAMLGAVNVSEFMFKCMQYWLLFWQINHVMNLSFALFNLIPLPPLDGSKILSLFIPKKHFIWLLQHERQLSLFFMIWLLLGSRLSNFLLSYPSIATSPILSFIVKCFSLTGWLGDAVSFLSDLIYKLLELIPFL